jgi:hypothetical protein
MHVMGISRGLRNMSLGMLCESFETFITWKVLSELWNMHNMKSFECKLCSGITQFDIIYLFIYCWSYIGTMVVDYLLLSLYMSQSNCMHFFL